jgi:hypothetical protein
VPHIGHHPSESHRELVAVIGPLHRVVGGVRPQVGSRRHDSGVGLQLRQRSILCQRSAKARTPAPRELNATPSRQTHWNAPILSGDDT